MVSIEAICEHKLLLNAPIPCLHNLSSMTIAQFLALYNFKTTSTV